MSEITTLAERLHLCSKVGEALLLRLSDAMLTEPLDMSYLADEYHRAVVEALKQKQVVLALEDGVLEALRDHCDDAALSAVPVISVLREFSRFADLATRSLASASKVMGNFEVEKALTLCGTVVRVVDVLVRACFLVSKLGGFTDTLRVWLTVRKAIPGGERDGSLVVALGALKAPMAWLRRRTESICSPLIVAVYDGLIKHYGDAIFAGWPADGSPLLNVGVTNARFSGPPPALSDAPAFSDAVLPDLPDHAVVSPSMTLLANAAESLRAFLVTAPLVFPIILEDEARVAVASSAVSALPSLRLTADHSVRVAHEYKLLGGSSEHTETCARIVASMLRRKAIPGVLLRRAAVLASSLRVFVSQRQMIGAKSLQALNLVTLAQPLLCDLLELKSSDNVIQAAIRDLLLAFIQVRQILRDSVPAIASIWQRYLETRFGKGSALESKCCETAHRHRIIGALLEAELGGMGSPTAFALHCVSVLASTFNMRQALAVNLGTAIMVCPTVDAASPSPDSTLLLISLIASLDQSPDFAFVHPSTAAVLGDRAIAWCASSAEALRGQVAALAARIIGCAAAQASGAKLWSTASMETERAAIAAVVAVARLLPSDVAVFDRVVNPVSLVAEGLLAAHDDVARQALNGIGAPSVICRCLDAALVEAEGLAGLLPSEDAAAVKEKLSVLPVPLIREAAVLLAHRLVPRPTTTQGAVAEAAEDATMAAGIQLTPMEISALTQILGREGSNQFVSEICDCALRPAVADMWNALVNVMGLVEDLSASDGRPRGIDVEQQSIVMPALRTAGLTCQVAETVYRMPSADIKVVRTAFAEAIPQPFRPGTPQGPALVKMMPSLIAITLRKTRRAQLWSNEGAAAAAVGARELFAVLESMYELGPHYLLRKLLAEGAGVVAAKMPLTATPYGPTVLNALPSCGETIASISAPMRTALCEEDVTSITQTVFLSDAAGGIEAGASAIESSIPSELTVTARRILSSM